MALHCVARRRLVRKEYRNGNLGAPGASRRLLGSLPFLASFCAFFKGMKTEDKTVASVTGRETYDHTELSDMPTDAFVRFDKRNGLVGIAFPKFLDYRRRRLAEEINRLRAGYRLSFKLAKNFEVANKAHRILYYCL